MSTERTCICNSIKTGAIAEGHHTLVPLPGVILVIVTVPKGVLINMLIYKPLGQQKLPIHRNAVHDAWPIALAKGLS